MFLWNMLNDSLCHEDYSKKHDFQQYNPDYGISRRNLPEGSRASAAGFNGAFNSSNELPSAAMESAAAWSRSPPHQNGGRGPAASPPNQRTRGVGNSANAAPWNQRHQDRPNARAADNGRPSQDGRNGRGHMRPPSGQGSMYERGDEVTSKAEGRSSGNRQQPQQPKETRDTVIGKGFTAAMKRGVAQAKPTPAREELQQQKDGGFIATIQRGFEGLFGKPTSKEEVLRKRGAVFANEYEAVPGDEIDQAVQYFARRLPEDVSGCLKIFREAKGEYQINDETVNMEQKFRQGPNGQTETEIFVFWTTEIGEQSDPEPLGLYLSHAANVAFEVKQGGNVITQVPDHARISFHDEIGTKLTSGSAEARFNAMEVAARQAKMREEAAMEWREKQNNPSKGVAPAECPSMSMESPRHFPDRPPSTDARCTADRLPSADGPAETFIEAALQAVGARPAPQAPPASAPSGMTYAAPAATAPAGLLPPNPVHTLPNGLNISGYGAPQAGTFMSQASYLPRQGTMYGYGSASPPGVMAAAAGYPPMPRQGTMYAYGSAYAVPVR